MRRPRAMSSGSPNRPNGVWAIVCSFCSSLITSVSAVGTKPGATTFTVMPRLPTLSGKALGQAYHSGLAGRIVRLSGLSRQADYAGYVDNSPPTLPDHAAKRGPGYMKNAVQVCADHRAPPFFFHAHQQRVAGRTRVIDQDVDSAQLLFNHLHQLGGLVKTAHISLEN